MPGSFVDNVGGLTTTTTTGAYQGFSAWGQADPFSGLANGTYAYKAIPYPVTPAEPTEYETGEGTWNGSTLTRGTVKTSSNGGSAVDWTGQRVLVVVVADTDMLNQWALSGHTHAQLHDPVTVSNSAEIDFTLTGQDITAGLIAGSIDETKLDASVNASLDLADSAQQPPSEGPFVNGDKNKLDGIEAGADITDTANVTAAGALMDSEVDADIKTLSLPANVTITSYTATLLDDTTAAAARATLDVDQAGTDNSTDVTLAGTPDYLTIAGQVITLNQIDLTADVTGDLPVTEGGTGASNAAGAKTNLGYMTDLEDDTSPQLGGDLGAQNKNIESVKRVLISGDTVEYTAIPGAFVYYDSNHSYDYNGNTSGIPLFDGVILPSAVHFQGTHTIGRSASLAGMGFLFNATPTITNESGSAFNLSSFYTLNAQPSFVADNAAIGQGISLDIVSQPSMSATGGSGSLSVTGYHQFKAQGVVGAGATLTERKAFFADNMTVTGTLTAQAGLVSDVSNATHNTGLLLGTDTVPTTGDYGVYQDDDAPNHWSGGQQWELTRSGAATISATKNDHYFVTTRNSAVTFNLPDSTATGANTILDGQAFRIRAAGTGTVTVTATGGTDAVNGTATITSGNSAEVVLHKASNTWYMFP